jgi:formylglycine-generating enzyme required for sulfatase activity
MAYASRTGTCIDRYEASRGAGDVPESAAGAMPWTGITWTSAAIACQDAGKRLCGRNEWETACQGPNVSAYPYGDVFDPDACNGHDNTNFDTIQPTGSLEACEGGYPEVYDMIGNVWEWTGSCTLLPGTSVTVCYAVGSSQLSGDQACLSEHFGNGLTTLGFGHVGFRCCLSP